MQQSFSQKSGQLWWKARNTHAIGKIPWSAIRRIGQSRLIALTIVVPFLGSILLFNQSIVEILTLSPDLVRRWLHVTVAESPEAARRLTLARLYYVYFGLTFLGIGSALFVLFCPLYIKNYSTEIDYQTTEGPLVSKSKMTLIVPFVALEYSRWFGDEDYISAYRLMRGLGQPDDFQVLFSVVISEIYSSLPEDDVSDDTVSAVGAEDNGHPYEDFRHRPDPVKIANVFHSGRRLEMGFVDEIEERATAPKFRNDVLTLHYMALDHTKPFLRLTIAGFYGLGFALLLIPTAKTFISVSINVLAHQ